jgi:hypothetical protein
MENMRHSQLFALHEMVPKYAKCVSARMENALKENKRTWKLFCRLLLTRLRHKFEPITVTIRPKPQKLGPTL